MDCRRYLITIGCLGMLCFGAGCNAGADGLPEGDYPCESDGDCIEGYECVDGICEEPVPLTAPPCDQSADPEGDIDLDDDGYGDGADRTNCPPDKYQLDCDDTRSDISPGAPELCDGVDNDCDDQVDEFDCQISTDCGAVPSDLRRVYGYECEANKCVLRPSVRPEGTVCQEVRATCDTNAGAFTYEVDGQTYRGTEGPAGECD
ncbi:hypothetical protein FIV42_09830 [Persicimonas caeni]|uniref:Uncharacterized protein n=1 Tax=Persicimonas caeni TaxID=2292766 RepID=A0A4Y6PSD0_PERCE|nr:putative metal-binding motif-containing protein [Persicimonas caeni]QDG51019.1 hypothetical protein FIV42_09830 [Persicimonas caeni]QED32240.1 hypothetical protein FRD00_09825 [Persicimonas caeni]